MQETPVLALHAVSKSYGAVEALTDISMELHAGEVVGLVGDNGAGKSTLVKAASGVISPDEGEIRFCGEPVEFHNPRDASNRGIAVIYQDLALCDNLDVVENLFLGRERYARRGPALLDAAGMEHEAAALLRDLNVGAITSLRTTVERLSGGQRQTIAIARALLGDPRVVMLDEPTAALGVPQSRQVLKVVRTLAERRLAVLIISHNIADVFAVCDRIIVLRLGKVVGSYRRDLTTPEEIVAAITGAGSRPELVAEGIA
jgi:D-xylose transport system ATP-binding protein